MIYRWTVRRSGTGHSMAPQRREDVKSPNSRLGVRPALLLLLAAAVGVVVPGATSPALAHQDGCHRWHSCPSDSGSYVCGDLGYFDECGTSAPDQFVEPELVYDFDPPRRPRLQPAVTGAKGLVTLPITAEAGSRIVVRGNGRTVVTAIGTGGVQRLSFSTATGRHTYKATATDASGNTSSVASVTVTADATPPASSQFQIAAGAPTDSRTRISLLTDPATRYDFAVDGRHVSAGRTPDGMLDFARTLRNGRHSLQLRLTDKVGNQRLISRAVRVAVPRLEVDAEVISEPNRSEQLVQIAGSPGARLLLELGGEVVRRVVLSGGGNDVVDLTLDDGTYSGLAVTLIDAVGRRGTTRLAPITVDTTSPVLRIAARESRIGEGLAAWNLRGEPQAAVSWRILDSDDRVVDHGSGTLTDVAENVEADVAEGDYRVEVTARDAAGNDTTQDLAMTVPADPITPGAIAAAVAALLALLVTVGLLIWAAWRNRHRIAAWRLQRRLRAAQRAADRAYAAQLAAHQAEVTSYEQAVRRHQELDTAWDARRRHLRHLHELARNDYGSAPQSFDNVKLRRGERVLTTVRGALVDTRTRQGTSYLDVTDVGRVTITSARVVFNGTKKREWAFDKLEAYEHRGPARTLMKVTNRKAPSGVDYAEEETTRLYVDLALADFHGSRDRVINDIGRRLHAHEQARPMSPQPVGPPPTRPVPETATAGL